MKIPAFLNRIQTKLALLLFAVAFATIYFETRFSDLHILRLEAQNMKVVINSIADVAARYVEKMEGLTEKTLGLVNDERLKVFRNQFNSYLTTIMESVREDGSDYFLFVFVTRNGGRPIPGAAYVNDGLVDNVRFPKGLGAKELPGVVEEFHRVKLAPIEKQINEKKSPASYSQSASALPRIFDGQVILYSKPMMAESGGKVVGWVIAGILRDQVVSFRTDYLKKFLVYGTALFIVVFAVSFLISRHITSPLPLIVAGMARVRDGNLDTRVEVGRGDETGMLADAFNEMVVGLKRGLMVENNFKKYVSRQVADELLNSGFQMKEAGESKKVTVLFADIRNFTTISEKRRPEEIVTILNCYFSEMIDVIFKYDGTLDKFIGDAIMATFGVPKAGDDDAKRAVACAIEMHKRLFILNKRKNFPEDLSIEIGIGINTGIATAGVIGSNHRMEYTVIGDTVNIASRLEGLNKEFNSKILISEHTYEEVKDLIRATDLGEHKVKGRENKIRIYAVNGVIKKEGPSV